MESLNEQRGYYLGSDGDTPEDSGISSTDHGYNPASKVQLFRDALAVLNDKPIDDQRIVPCLCSLLLVVFRDIIERLRDSKIHENDNTPARTSLQRSLDRLRLWSDGYRICDGDQDVTFIKSRRLRRASIEVLVSISDTLLDRLDPLAGSKKTEISNTAEESVQKLKDALEIARTELDFDASSSDDSSHYGSDSLEEIGKDLETDTLSLMGLDAIFQSAISDLLVEKTTFADKAHAWLPHAACVYKDRIRIRFPKAEDSLLSRLSQASQDRYLRCQREREKQDRRERTAQANLYGHESPKSKRSITTGTKSRRSNAASSKSKPSDVAGLKSQESVSRTSIPFTASVAKRVLSYHSEGAQKGISVQIPPLSEKAKDGQLFECTCCGKLLYATTDSAWERHIYQDLLPWQCLDPDCSFTAVFQTREDWTTHIAQDHKLEPDWEPITCPLCLEETASGKSAITDHLSSHLEEISLASLPTNKDPESHSGLYHGSGSSESQEESMDETDEKLNASSRKPVLRDALSYMDQVKLAFHDRPSKYHRFLDIMKDFESAAIDTPGVMRLVRYLFLVEDQVPLIAGFNKFLPSGYAIDKDLNFRMPSDPVSNFYPKKDIDDDIKNDIFHSAARSAASAQNIKIARAYVNRVELRLIKEPDKYHQFLEIIQKYQREATARHQLYESVSALFASAPELIDDFDKLLLRNLSSGGTGDHLNVDSLLSGRK